MTKASVSVVQQDESSEEEYDNEEESDESPIIDEKDVKVQDLSSEKSVQENQAEYDVEEDSNNSVIEVEGKSKEDITLDLTMNPEANSIMDVIKDTERQCKEQFHLETGEQDSFTNKLKTKICNIQSQMFYRSYEMLKLCKQ